MPYDALGTLLYVLSMKWCNNTLAVRRSDAGPAIPVKRSSGSFSCLYLAVIGTLFSNYSVFRM